MTDREQIVRLFLSMRTPDAVGAVLQSAPDRLRGPLLRLVRSAAARGIAGLAVPGGAPEPGLMELQRASKDELVNSVLPAVKKWAEEQAARAKSPAAPPVREPA